MRKLDWNQLADEHGYNRSGDDLQKMWNGRLRQRHGKTEGGWRRSDLDQLGFTEKERKHLLNLVSRYRTNNEFRGENSGRVAIPWETVAKEHNEKADKDSAAEGARLAEQERPEDAKGEITRWGTRTKKDLQMMWDGRLRKE